MKKVLSILVGALLIFTACSEERQVYNTSNHGYRHGRKTKYYREYRGYAHRGDYNKVYDYNARGWEIR